MDALGIHCDSSNEKEADMPGQFEGKVAVITGASSGIGRACAFSFANRGACVVVADIAVEGGDETVRQIKASGGEAMFFECDVSRASQVEDMVNAAAKTYGGLDYACNNAGIDGGLFSTVDYPDEIWDQVIDINLKGPWLCMKYEIPQMIQQGGGAIVNVSSILGTVGFAEASGYVAAKHGMIGITKTAALEYATQGIRVNAVCPAFIATPMQEKGDAGEGSELYPKIVELHPMKRLGKPEEVSEAVIWLCSDASAFVTGHAMLIDGGYVAQ